MSAESVDLPIAELRARVEVVCQAWVEAAGEATNAHPAQKAAVRGITSEIRKALSEPTEGKS